jgi:integrase
MRLREMYTLTLDQVSISESTIYLEKTKNGHKRQVPLSSVAKAALNAYLDRVRNQTHGLEGFEHAGGRLLPFWNGDASPASLRLTTTRLSAAWRSVSRLADCNDLRFHDLRHEATSRLYERTDLSDLEISKITGHKSMTMLARYANLRASSLAQRLW